MSIEKFVKTLLPSIDRSTILEDANATLDELNEHSIPPYLSTMEAKLFTSDSNFQSDWMYRRQKEFSARFRNSRFSVIEAIAATLPNVAKRMEFVVSALEKELPHDLAREGISYPKAALIQISELAMFVSRYSRRFLLLCYAVEIPEMSKEISRDKPFSRIELKQIEEQFQSFLSALEIFQRDDASFVKAIDSIPDMLVDLENIDLAHVVANGSGNLNPLSLGFISHVWNPIYHIRIGAANWQNSRYLAAKEERKAIEYRLAQLRTLTEGEHNAALEKVIENTERRVMDLNAKIASMEKVK